MITLVFLAAKPESGRANRNASTQMRQPNEAFRRERLTASSTAGARCLSSSHGSVSILNSKIRESTTKKIPNEKRVV